MSERREAPSGAGLHLSDGVVITRFRDDPLLEEEGDDGIVTDTSTGRFMFINGSALDFLEALLETGDARRAADRLLETYDVDAGTLTEDIERFQAQLAALQLLVE